jgi:hypothetical protein
MERVNDPTFDRNPATSPMDLELMQASSDPQEGQGQQFTASQYYELMMETCERLFDNQVEQLVFEDQMREMFGLHARFFLSLPSFCHLKTNECRTRTESSPSIKFSLLSLNM